jgi:hypothetical protein
MCAEIQGVAANLPRALNSPRSDHAPGRPYVRRLLLAPHFGLHSTSDRQIKGEPPKFLEPPTARMRYLNRATGIASPLALFHTQTMQLPNSATPPTYMKVRSIVTPDNHFSCPSADR